MKKIKTLYIVFAGSVMIFMANPVKGTELTPPDSVQQTRTSSHSLFLGAGYGDNLVLGSTISKPQSYFHGALTYGFKNEFFLSATSFYLPDFNNIPAFNVFSANYSHAFNTWFDISLSLSGFKSHSELSDTLFSSFMYGDLTLGLDWRFIYTKVSVSRILSGSTYVQVKNSRYFQTPDLFSGKLNVSFEPYCNLLFGPLTKITTSDGTSIGVDSPVWTGGGYGDGSGSGSGSGNGPGSGSGSTGSTPTTLTSVFYGLMEVDFGLPVAFNTGKITFEVEPVYVLPMFTDPSIPSPEGFSMMCNLYIKIF